MGLPASMPRRIVPAPQFPPPRDRLMSSDGTPPYQLSVDGLPGDYFRVQAFKGRETISEAYSFEIIAIARASADDEVERTALGQKATFTWNIGKTPRAFYGVVAAVRL